MAQKVKRRVEVVEVVGIYRPGRAMRLSRPLVECRVSAGFPSPAQDEIAGRIDLNREHPLATFYVRVEGDSMEPRIHCGELLVVDRMIATNDGDIVVARLGQEFTVKRLHTGEDGGVWLAAENPAKDVVINHLETGLREPLEFGAFSAVAYNCVAN